jgi:hypothetical protein
MFDARMKKYGGDEHPWIPKSERREEHEVDPAVPVRSQVLKDIHEYANADQYVCPTNSVRLEHRAPGTPSFWVVEKSSGSRRQVEPS